MFMTCCVPVWSDPGMTTTTPADVLARAARVRLACFDVDGCLTDGRLIYYPDGSEAKAFQVLDGQGLRLLEECGIAVALVTARNTPSVDRRGADLRLSRVCQGVKDKGAQVEMLAESFSLQLDEVAFFGDDLPDLSALRRVGLAGGPANAHAWIVPHLHWQSVQRGGDGAARAFCDLILEAQGQRAAILGRFGG